MQIQTKEHLLWASSKKIGCLLFVGKLDNIFSIIIFYFECAWRRVMSFLYHPTTNIRSFCGLCNIMTCPGLDGNLRHLIYKMCTPSNIKSCNHACLYIFFLKMVGIIFRMKSKFSPIVVNCNWNILILRYWLNLNSRIHSKMSQLQLSH